MIFANLAESRPFETILFAFKTHIYAISSLILAEGFVTFVAKLREKACGTVLNIMKLY